MKMHGCSDGGCVFGHPGGMHTNGGCACLKHLDVHKRRELRGKIMSIKADRDLLLAIRDAASKLSAMDSRDREHSPRAMAADSALATALDAYDEAMGQEE